MTFFYFVIYNFIFWPLFYLLSHLISLFNRKLRHGIAGRYGLHRQIKKSNISRDEQIAVVHCASMGEFEHIKPFLIQLKSGRPQLKIIVLFFSPSGFDNVKNFAGIDLFIYAPFDWFFPVLRFMKKIRPDIWIIAKHDVWPNQVWLCKLLHIPVVLINASLHNESSRLHPITRNFHQHIYRYFSSILTISTEDKKNFSRIADADHIIVAGDTKYDQVVRRKEESQSKQLIPPSLLKNKWVFVAGSSWPEDETHLIPAIRAIHQKHPDFLAIICPHEPTESHLTQLMKNLNGLSAILLSQIGHYNGENIILIDRIGVLANLYSLAKCAYVGGSFKQNIHNVLEPAVYHIPVLFGPVNSNSHEARLLKQNGGAMEVNNGGEIKELLDKFINDFQFLQETGKKAGQIVSENCGATERTVKSILNYLEEK